MPVLAHDDAEPAHADAQPEPPIASTGTTHDWTIDELPVDDLQPLAPVASTGNHARWRVERFGPKAPDGKGRYWQWRRGSGKQREATYGGKIQNDATEYWHNRNADTHGHTESGD